MLWFLPFVEKKNNCFQVFDVSVNFRKKIAESGSKSIILGFLESRVPNCLLRIGTGCVVESPSLEGLKRHRDEVFRDVVSWWTWPRWFNGWTQ